MDLLLRNILSCDRLYMARKRGGRGGKGEVVAEVAGEGVALPTLWLGKGKVAEATAESDA